MSTISEIINNFCYRVNITAPGTVIGNESPAARQYLSLFKFIGDNLRNRPYQWPQLKRGYYFTTDTDKRRYQLPGDFYRILESSQWDTSNNWPMRGPISDYNFAVREFAVVSLQTRKAFRLIGPTQYLFNTAPYVQKSAGYFEIDPPGQEGVIDTLFLGYLSCNWIWPQNWSANTPFTVGDIRSDVTQDTKEGFVMICTQSGTSGDSYPLIIPSDDAFVDGTCEWIEYRQPYQVDSSNTNLSDDDLCQFDDDLMIEGMRWAWYRAKKQDYQQERADWEAQVKSAYNRFNGPQRINAADEMADYFDWPNIPQGSWDV